MTNLRRLLKTPTLRLRDGGSSFGDGLSPAFSLGRMADTEQNQQAAAGVFARTPEGTSSMAGPPASGMATANSPAPAAMGGLDANKMGAAALANSMSYRPMMAMPQMRDGGTLRTGQGGHVPGSGQGDKIPAKYEPGEFVVSNAMLDAAPGLRGQLHGLRGNVLAAKGVSVEEANAKAVSGGSLRAASGGLYPYNMPDKDIYAGLGKPSSAPENTPLPGSITGGAGRRLRAPAPTPMRAEAPVATVQRPELTAPGAGLRGSMAYDAGTNIPGGVNARNQKPAYKGIPSVGTLDTGGAGRIGPSGPGVPGVAGGQGGPDGNLLREAFPGVSATLRGGGEDMADAWGQGKYVKSAFTGLRQLATLPVALTDDVIGGFGRGAFNLLRNPAEDAGRALLGMEDRKPDAPAPVAQPVNPPAQPAPNPYAHSPGDATMPGQDPNRVTLRGQAGTDIGSGISKFVQGGKTLYSNVPGADNDKLMSNSPGVSTVPGMGREEIDRTLTNPDGSRWSAGDNAIMAANLRDGQDAYRGTSRAQGEAPDTLRQLAASPFGTPGRNGAIKAMVAQDQNRATLRGQDLDYGAKLSQQQTAARTAAAAARADQQNKDRTYEIDVARFGEEAANKARDNKRAGEKAFDDRISGFVGTDREGKPDARAASAVRNAANTFLSGKQAEMEAALAKDPGNKRAAAILDDIRKNGVGGIDDATLRTILLGQQGNTVAREFDGVTLNPWAGKATNTQKPVTSLRLQNNMLMPNQYVTDNGQLIPQRAVEDHPDLRSLIRQ